MVYSLCVEWQLSVGGTDTLDIRPGSFMLAGCTGLVGQMRNCYFMTSAGAHDAIND
jgi:hypothetical protein